MTIFKQHSKASRTIQGPEIKIMFIESSIGSRVSNNTLNLGLAGLFEFCTSVEKSLLFKNNAFLTQ